jgi:hypothetical protein
MAERDRSSGLAPTLGGAAWSLQVRAVDNHAKVIATESIRQEWEDGYRRFEAAIREPAAQARLLAQLEIITDELRRRVGQTFTIQQLAAAYERADVWALDAVSEHAATPGWPRTVAMVLDAAFHLYQRGAIDYTP